MIKKLGNMLLIGIMTFGQPMATFADTVIDDFQEHHPDQVDVLKEAENSSEDSLILDDDNIEDSKNVTNENSNEEINPHPTSGTWGTTRWDVDLESQTIRISGGRGGSSEQAPWFNRNFDINTIVFEETVVLQPRASFLFSQFRGSIQGLEKLDTTNVTEMRGMFQNSWETNLDLSSFDTRNVRNMNNMFGHSRVTDLNVSSFDTSNVTDMGGMFRDIPATSLDVSNFDTRNVNRMDIMFFNTRITNLDVSSFDTSKVTTMRYMFSQTRMIDFDVSNFDTSNVVNMEHMFSNSFVESLNLMNFNTNKVTNMSNMFFQSRGLRQLVLGSNFRFLPGAALTTVPSTSGFLGVWQSVGDGSISNPLGEFQFTSSELMSNYSGETMSDIYVWKPNLPGGRIIVYYEDIDGIALSEVVIINAGQIGMPYTTKAKDIPGYSLLKVPENASGVFTAEEQEVRYIYERTDAAPVTVKHKDSEGNQLAEPVILSGKVGLPYASAAKEIPGWYVAETPDNASGTFTEEAQEVVYVYERSDAAPVTVKHKDSEGNQLADPVILSGKVGLPYASAAKEIPGWYVVETPDNASGTFTEEAQEVVYVYERSDAAPVTVKHKDSEGNQLADPVILSGKVGLPYASAAKEIPGWYVAETPDNASGIFTEDPQEVVYIYAINKIDSEHDNSDNNLPTDNNFSDSHKRLPDTGESLIGQLSMILAGLLIVIGIFVFLIRRRKNNKD